MKKIALFGCGSGLEFYLKLTQSKSNNQIVVIFDRNSSIEQMVDGINVVNPKYIEQYQFDKIIITARYYVEMYNQLIVLGVPEEKIEVFAHLINFCM